MRVAVVGGLARQAADCTWKYPGIDVTHYNAEEIRRVVESATRGGADAVILVTKFVAHQTEAAIRKTGVRMIRWDQGLKELSRKLPSLVNPTVTVNGTPKANGAHVNGHAPNVPATPVVAQPERSWVDRVVEVLRLNPKKLWTTRDIMEELGIGAGKQPRVSEALVKLRARGMARAEWVGREKGHRYVPEGEQEAAKAEYLREQELAPEPGAALESAQEPPERLETQQEMLEATGHILPSTPSTGMIVPSNIKDAARFAIETALATTQPPEDHTADLGTIFARARRAKKKAAARVLELEVLLKTAHEELAKAESDEAGALAMLDEMGEE